MTALLDLIDEIEDIKGDLRTAINNKGASLTSSTPFADYVTAVDNLPTAEAVLSKTLSGAQTFNIQTLGSNGLSDNYNMTSISLPSCTNVGERAIQMCANLTSASLPVYEGWTLNITDNGNAELVYNGSGYYCFEGCINLTTAYLPSLKIIPSDFFADCRALTTLTATGIYGTCGSAFREYEEWEPDYHRVTQYDQMKNLGLNFMNYRYLHSMSDVLRDYIRDTDNNVTDTLTFSNLQYCQELFRYEDWDDPADPLYAITTVNVPDLRHISDWSNNRWRVQTLDLPNIRRLGNHSFDGCDALTTINIGNKVTYIGWEAFSNCQNVETINIDIDENTQDQTLIDDVINRAPWGLDQSVTINYTGSEE